MSTNPSEPPLGPLWMSHLRLRAAFMIYSPVGRLLIPNISTRVKIGNRIVNGDKIKAQKAANAARQAFPDMSQQRAHPRNTSTQQVGVSADAAKEITGNGLGPHGVVRAQIKAPPRRTTESDLSR